MYILIQRAIISLRTWLKVSFRHSWDLKGRVTISLRATLSARVQHRARTRVGMLF